jgi:hypothetical protein
VSLTVVSFNEKMFTCDNGKSYLTIYSKWMTDGIVVNQKVKRTKKYKPPTINNVSKSITCAPLADICMYYTKWSIII